MKKITLFFILGFGLNSYCQALGGGMTDIDGNTYNSVIIGTQEWTKQNLNVSKYSDGTPIPEVTDPTQWANLTTGAWCYYANNTANNGPIFGKLYNWYAVAGIYDAESLANPPLRKNLAPTGWHVPSNVEWNTLTTFLGGEGVAGGKMKSTGTTSAGTGLWAGTNEYATNVSGFSGLPAGYRTNDGTFNYIRLNATWWSSSENDTTVAWWRSLNTNVGIVESSYASKKYGFSVRLMNNTLLDNQSIKSNSFNIYPNPAIDNVVIDLGNLTIVSNWSYKITNTLGQEVIKGKIASQQTTINLNEIKSKGMYFVKIYDALSNVLETKKLIIN